MNKTFTVPISRNIKDHLLQHMMTILNHISQRRSKEIVDEVVEQTGGDDPMTQGLHLSSANNILDLTAKRSTLILEKENLKGSRQLENDSNYHRQISQSPSG